MSDREPDEEPTLGPCGCTDYHMADCPLLTDRGADDPRPDPDEWYDDMERGFDDE